MPNNDFQVSTGVVAGVGAAVGVACIAAGIGMYFGLKSKLGVAGLESSSVHPLPSSSISMSTNRHRNMVKAEYFDESAMKGAALGSKEI